MRRLAIALWLWPVASAAQPVTNAETAAGDPAVIAIVGIDGRAGCTASVIGEHTAITAAHCVYGRDPKTLRVFFGRAIEGGGWYLQVTDTRTHPGFDPGGRDIAMMTLRQPARAAPLALASSLDASLVGTSFRVVGFGITGQGQMDEGTKREGTARIVKLQAEDFTAVPGPSLSCLGDSGGPALLPSGEIAGVVSRVDTKCVDHADYTRVDIAKDVLIDPYLAETAPGTAGEGEPCFYDDHCAAGLECLGEDDRICEPAAGCGCASGSMPASTPLLVLMILGAVRRRRRGRPTRRSECCPAGTRRSEGRLTRTVGTARP